MRNLLVLAIVTVLSLVQAATAHASSEDFINKLLVIQSGLKTNVLTARDASIGISMLQEDLSKISDKNEKLRLGAALSAVRRDADERQTVELCPPRDVECVIASLHR